MGQIETCPCCGIERETQHHLYLCTNENMRNTLIDSIKTAKSKLVRDTIPSLVYNKFTKQICLATKTSNPDAGYEHGTAELVARIQARLGEEAFLKGFLHNKWTRVLNKMWRPAPPDREGKKVHQKDASE